MAPASTFVAHGHRHRNDHGRRRGSDETRFVLTDAVTYAVHLDQESGGARDRDDMEALVAQGESTLVLTEPFDPDDEFAAVSVDAVAARTDLAHREGVGLALVVEFHPPADGVGGARSTTTRRGQEAARSRAFLGFIRVDRGGDERDVGRRRRAGRPSAPVRSSHPVSADGGHHFVAVE